MTELERKLSSLKCKSLIPSLKMQKPNSYIHQSEHNEV